MEKKSARRSAPVQQGAHAHQQQTASSSSPAPVQRVLVIKLSSLGDLFHALPTVHCLKAGLSASIDWVVHPAYQELAGCFTDVDRVIPLARNVWDGTLPDNVRALRATQYDLIIDLQGILKSALVSRIARGAQRIGPSFHREGSRLFYQKTAGAPNRDRHAVEQNLDIVRCLGLPLLPPVFPVSFPRQPLAEPEPRVALIPFTRWPSKNWPTSAFIQAGRDLQEHANASIFLIGSHAEAEVCESMKKEIKGRVVNLAGELSLPQLGGTLQAMNLVIANDSGPMHMAASLGIPVLAVYGPTDPKRTGPYACPSATAGQAARHRIIRGKLRCQPCFARRCRYEDNACLTAITPEQITTAALEMLTAETGAVS